MAAPVVLEGAKQAGKLGYEAAKAAAPYVKEGVDAAMPVVKQGAGLFGKAVLEVVRARTCAGAAWLLRCVCCAARATACDANASRMDVC